MRVVLCRGAQREAEDEKGQDLVDTQEVWPLFLGAPLWAEGTGNHIPAVTVTARQNVIASLLQVPLIAL